MNLRRFLRSPSVVLGLVLASGAAHSQAPGPLRIGVLTDMSSGFSGWSGKGSVSAAQMAVEDYERNIAKLPFKVEILSADHQNKADVGSSLTRKWLDEGVNAIVDVPNSAVLLAVNFLMKNSNAVFLVSGGGHDSITAKECSPNTVHWTFDLGSLARNTATTVVERGGTTWFFMTADYAGGLGLEKVATEFATAAGAKILGSARSPINTVDYSSFLLQAQGSKARIVALAMGGSDFVNAVKQAGEFGLVDGGQKMMSFTGFMSDINSLGLKSAQGIIATTAYYWDMDDGKRAFAKRFAERNGGAYPSDVQAGVYASIQHYLKAVSAAGTRDGPKVVERMKAIPTDDPLFGRGRIRSDGRAIHDMYVVEVKSPKESKGPWDFFKILKTVPAEKAFRPEAPDECPLVKR